MAEQETLLKQVNTHQTFSSMTNDTSSSEVAYETVHVKERNMETLTRELEEEHIMSNSLTQLVAEKSAEIFHLQNLLNDQEVKINKLESGVEDLTNLLDEYEKKLDLKNLEVEHLKRTVEVEKQQRRDLEEMMMDIGLRNIEEKEQLEKQIKSLQEKLTQASQQGVKVQRDIEVIQTNTEYSSEVVDGVKKDKGAKETKEDQETDEEEVIMNKAEAESLIDNLMEMLKHNEGLKSEMELLKAENSRMLEEKRKSIADLTQKYEETYAETEHQRAVIKRLDSSLDEQSMLASMSLYENMKSVREEAEELNNELNAKVEKLQETVDEQNIELESLTKRNEKLKNNLNSERDQNKELNNQILEVSLLYDECYSKCETIEKELQLVKKNGIQTRDASTMSEGCKETTTDNITQYVNNGSKRKGSKTHSNQIPTSKKRKLLKGKHHLADEDLDQEQNPIRDEDEQSEIDVYTEVYSSHHFLSGGIITATFITFSSLLLLINWSPVPYMHTASAAFSFLAIFYAIRKSGSSNTTQHQDMKVPSNGIDLDAENNRLRIILKDAISRLTSEDFEELRLTYHEYIKQPQLETIESDNVDELRQELEYLKSKNKGLHEGIKGFKHKNSIHFDEYEGLKKEVGTLRAARKKEIKLKDDEIMRLKTKIKELGGNYGVTNMATAQDKTEQVRGPLQCLKNGLRYAKYLLVPLLIIYAVSIYDESMSGFGIVATVGVLGILLYRYDTARKQLEDDNLQLKKAKALLEGKLDDIQQEHIQHTTEFEELTSIVNKEHQTIRKQRVALEQLETKLKAQIQRNKQGQEVITHLTDRIKLMPQIGTQSKDDNIIYKNLDSENGKSMMYIDNIEITDKVDEISGNVAKKAHTRTRFSTVGYRVQQIFTAVIFAIISYFVYGTIQYLDTASATSRTWLYSLLSVIISFLFPILVVKAREVYKLNIIQRENEDLQQKLKYETDKNDTMKDEIEVLNCLLDTERDYSERLTKQIETPNTAVNEESQVAVKLKAAFKDEVDSVVAKLIDMTSERDKALQQTNSLKEDILESKGKLNDAMQTINDIKEKQQHAADELKALRHQKRELQDDLMKEQMKNIEMYELLKAMQNKNHNCKSDPQSGTNLQKDGNAENEIEVDCTDTDGTPSDYNTSLNDSVNGEDVAVQELAQKLSEQETNLRDAKTQVEQFFSVTENLNAEIILLKEQNKELENALTAEKTKNDDLSREITFLKRGQKVDRGYIQETVVAREVNVVSSSLGDVRAQRWEPVQKRHVLEEDKVTTDDYRKFQLDLAQNQTSAAKEVPEMSNDKNIKEVKVQAPHGKGLGTAQNDKEMDLFEGLQYSERYNVGELYKELQVMADEIAKLNEVCGGAARVIYAGSEQWIIQDFVKLLTDEIRTLRDRASSGKDTHREAIGDLEQRIADLQKQVKRLQDELRHEKAIRSKLIAEYEDEYERLEGRLTEAYENLRKRLIDERVLRNEIVKEYEAEIEEVERKAVLSLTELREQLKQERMAANKAKEQEVVLADHLQNLQKELSGLQKCREEGMVDLNEEIKKLAEGKDGSEVKLKLIEIQDVRYELEEDHRKRMKSLKEKLDKALQQTNEYRKKIIENDNTLLNLRQSLEKHQQALSMQEKRMKDLEHEIRVGSTMDEDANGR